MANDSIKEILESAIKEERDKAKKVRKKITFPKPPKGFTTLNKPILKQCLYTFEEEDYV